MLAGATGLIGGQLLPLLLADDRYEKIIALTRSPLPSCHPKLHNIILDFSHLAERASDLKCDDIFCCLGTTIKKVKSKEAFRKVDFEYPMELAKIGKQQGARTYLLVSALGANAKSAIFYNQVKGEAEDSISKSGIQSIHILRPSLLLGPRHEQRRGEEAAKWFYKIFGWAIPARYQAIESIKIARAMISLSRQDDPGIFIHESNELQTYG